MQNRKVVAALGETDLCFNTAVAKKLKNLSNLPSIVVQTDSGSYPGEHISP